MPSEVVLGLTGGRKEGSGDPRPTRRVSQAAFRRYTQLLEEITGWVRKHRDRVAKVYLSSERGDAVRVCVIAQTPEYDFELTRSLSEFVAAMADEGFPLRGSQIPDGSPEELGAYFDVADSMVLSLD